VDDKTKAALRIALMGALTGGVVGGGAKMLGGAKKMSEILRAAGIGSALGGTAAAGTNLAGTTLMGEPEEGESSPYAKRGLLGGALLGALGGGALGAAGAAGKIPGGLKALVAKIGEEIPIENMITRKIGEYAKRPTKEGVKKGAMIGAAALGIPLGYEGFDEGVYFDAMQEEIAKEQRRKQIEELMREQYGV
jgi:hypothetical protein